MAQPVCDCGHEKRDHVFPLVIGQGYGSCKVCLCDNYNRKAEASATTVVSTPPPPSGRPLL